MFTPTRNLAALLRRDDSRHNLNSVQLLVLFDVTNMLAQLTAAHLTQKHKRLFKKKKGVFPIWLLSVFSHRMPDAVLLFRRFFVSVLCHWIASVFPHFHCL